VSLTAVTVGFLLNTVAARALGPDRTYYGHEVAGLARQRISSFPYGYLPHPMLVGNMVGFGGTLLNPDFRREWWPLAATHVALNVALLAMELGVTPLGRGEIREEPPVRASRILTWTACLTTAAGFGAVDADWIFWAGHRMVGASLGAAAVAHLVVMRLYYTRPSAWSRGWRTFHARRS
jgi:hypothetical protein